MKILYVHIGTPKTASSVIQEFCRDNNERLQNKGYYYPEFFFDVPYNPSWRAAVNGSFLQKESLVKKYMTEIGKLFQKYDHIILSDEQLWRRIYDERKTLWDELKYYAEQYDFEIRVIVYLRRQDELMESWWNQSLKGKDYRKAVSWEQYITDINENTQPDYYAALNRISAEIGKDRVIVRRYGRKYFPHGQIQEDFLGVLGLEVTDEYVIGQDILNPKFSGNTHEIKRIINSVPHLNREYNAFFEDILFDCSGISEEIYRCRMFSPEEARTFVEQYREGNRLVAREYLHEHDTDLFDMEFDGSPKWEKDNPYMIDDIIRFAGETTVHLLLRMNDMQKEIGELQSALIRLQKKQDALKEKLKTPIRSAYRSIRGRHK